MAEQKNRIRSLQTQTAILKAATRLARQNGWKDTRIQDICSLAGVSVGAFYHHFASKQELMNRAFLIFDDSLNDQLVAGNTSPTRAVKDVLMTQTSFIVKEAGGLIAEYYRHILFDRKKSAVSPDRKYYQAVLRYVREAENRLRQPYTPEYVCELLIKYVRGCIIDWCLHDYAYDLVKRTDAELDLLINALFE